MYNCTKEGSSSKNSGGWGQSKYCGGEGGSHAKNENIPESCVLPLADQAAFNELRSIVDDDPATEFRILRISRVTNHGIMTLLKSF